jgi:hypothetical protein
MVGLLAKTHIDLRFSKVQIELINSQVQELILVLRLSHIIIRM